MSALIDVFKRQNMFTGTVIFPFFTCRTLYFISLSFLNKRYNIQVNVAVSTIKPRLV